MISVLCPGSSTLPEPTVGQSSCVPIMVTFWLRRLMVVLVSIEVVVAEANAGAKQIARRATARSFYADPACS